MGQTRKLIKHMIIKYSDRVADTHTHTLLKIKQQTCMMEKGVKHYKLNRHQLINERLKILNLHGCTTRGSRWISLT